MVYRVPACVSRRAKHTSSSAYQHALFDQVGAPYDATIKRFSICGAMWRVRIFARLGDLADPEAWRLRIYVERADVYPAGAEVLPPAAGKRRPSVSGMRICLDTAACAGFSLISTHYPRIRGFRCSGHGTKHGFRLCPRHCLTSRWLRYLGCGSSLPTSTCRR